MTYTYVSNDYQSIQEQVIVKCKFLWCPKTKADKSELLPPGAYFVIRKKKNREPMLSMPLIKNFKCNMYM